MYIVANGDECKTSFAVFRARSPVKRRSRTPSPRTRAREKQERDAQRKAKEREDSLREEEEYEERQRVRRQREREKAYKEVRPPHSVPLRPFYICSLAHVQRLSMWESRERRKAKEYDKDYEKEEQRKEEMVIDPSPSPLSQSPFLCRREKEWIWVSSWKITMTRRTTRDIISKFRTVGGVLISDEIFFPAGVVSLLGGGERGN